MNSPAKSLVSPAPAGFSLNPRLERMFAAHPEHVNREYILPCAINETGTYVDPRIKGSSLEASIRAHLGTIIICTDRRDGADANLKGVKVLASPYECGRVLELDREASIDGKPYVITLKGVGATRFARETGAENPWMLPCHSSFTTEKRVALQKFPVLGRLGVMEKENAYAELKQAGEVSTLGVDAERVLGIFEISDIPDAAGKPRSVNYYKAQGIIRADYTPVIMVRAVKCNIRLLDLQMLVETRRTACTTGVVDYAKELYARDQGITNPSVKDYFNWLARKVLRQELSLIFKGYETSSGAWQDLGRNISIMGEELDLEAMKVNARVFHKERIYLDHIGRHFDCVESALRSFADCINTYYHEKIHFGEFAEIVAEEIDHAVQSSELQERFKTFQEVMSSSYAKFLLELKIRLYRKFDVTIFWGNDRECIELYQTTMRARHDALQEESFANKP